MKAHLLEPPFKIAWGPVLCVAAGIACVLGDSYVPGQGIDVWKLLAYVVAFLFGSPFGWLVCLTLLVLPLMIVISLYEELIFWLSLRRAPHSDRTVLVPGQVLTFRPPIPADVPPTVQGFGSKPMTHPTEIVEI
jgi:hypothetical protein